MPDDSLIDAFAEVARFKDSDLKGRIAQLEAAATGCSREALNDLAAQEGVSVALLRAAVSVKRAAAQIDAVVHATGMLLCLMDILNNDEVVETISLGAGNTGKQFDLETNRQIAEFTFIEWKGGSESIRKQKLFKDFYTLAEAVTHKERYLYFLGDIHLRKVFHSRSSCKGMLQTYAPLRDEFLKQYDAALSVCEYYEKRKGLVILQNLSAVSPTAAQIFPAAGSSKRRYDGKIAALEAELERIKRLLEVAR
jgi:hypothetical protein